MPREITEFRKKYRNISVKIERKARYYKLYDNELMIELDSALAGLYALTDDFMSPDEDGNYIIPDAGSIKLLKDAYLRCYKACDSLKDANLFDKKQLSDLINYIRSVLDRDYEALEAADPASGKTLSEIIEQGRSIAVDAGGQDPEKLKKAFKMPVTVKNRDNTYSDGMFFGPDGDDNNTYKRYIAFSVLAKLIAPNAFGNIIVPEAKPMIMVSGDKHVLGTFVTNPSGHNVKNADFPFSEMDSNVFDNPLVIRDISTISILNLICVNLDSDISSLNMKFGHVNNKSKIISVAVEDIGDALGKETFVYDEDLYERLSEINVIDSDVAANIMALKKETISSLFKGYGIPKLVIDSVWKTIELVKDAIERGTNNYKDRALGSVDKGDYDLRIVKDNEWAYYPLDKLSADGNIYSQFMDVASGKKLYADKTDEDEINVSKQNDSAPPVVTELPKKAAYNPEDAIRIGIENPPLIKIEIDKNEKFNIVKGSVSDRIPVTFIKNGREVKGFFTRLTHVNGLEKAKKVFDKYCKEHPEWSDEFSKIWDYISQDIYYYNKQDKPIELSRVGISEGREEELGKDQVFGEVLSSLWKDFQNAVYANNVSYINKQKMNKDAVYETRSVLINKISEVLGVPHVIAPTTNMQVQYGDELVDGIFMETIEGVNNEGCKDIPLKNDVFDGEVLRDISDLQIVDYLGLNTDRHTNNFIGVFTKGDDPKFRHVVGIDNDNSFGKIGTSYAVALKHIVIISEQTSERILNMDPEAFRRTLEGQGLPDDEIGCALDRFADLRESLEDGKIKIIKDDEWKNLTLKEVDDMGNTISIYSRILSDFEDNFKMGEKQGKTGELKPREFDYHKAVLKEEFSPEIVEKEMIKKGSQAVEIRFADSIREALDTIITDTPKKKVKSDAEIAKDNYTELENALNAVFAADSRFVRSSEQYRTMKRIATATIGKLHAINEKISEGTFEMADLYYMSGGFEVLSKAAADYESFKLKKLKGAKPNKYEKRRLNASKLLKEAAAKLSYDIAVNKTVNVEKETVNFSSPEKRLYSVMDDCCEKLIFNNMNGEQFKNAIARIIYYNAVKKNMARVRDDKNINNLFAEEIVNENIGKIKETRGFADIMAGDIKKIRQMAANERGASIFAEYLKHEAKYNKEPVRTIKTRRNPKEIVKRSTNNPPVK